LEHKITNIFKASIKGAFYFLIRKENLNMIKKTITYTDYNGVERKEDFYFNLSKAELMEMEIGATGGLAERIKKIVDAQDNAEIVKIFKTILLAAYGEKSDDGRTFRKSPEITKNFEQSEAYSQLFWELANDEEEAAKFVNGIIPANMTEELKQKQVEQIAAKGNAVTGA